VTTTESTLTVVQLDPRELTVHPRNVRTNLGDLTGLIASIAGQGVIEPLTVVPLQEGWQIVAGHRRAAAAIEGGLERVPCLVRPDLVGVDDEAIALHVGAMLAENLHREGLTPIEEAQGVQTMLDLGADIAAVAKRTGLDRKRVAKAAGVARLGQETATAVVNAGLTLDQAAVIARFEDDTEAIEELLEAAEEGPGEFAHAVTRAERSREAAARLNTRRAELVASGRTALIEEPDQTIRISGLLHNGEALTAESHASCPGSAVVLATVAWRDDVMEAEVCTDPAGNGHTSRWQSGPGPGASMSDAELERQRADRREVIENNKAMDAANITRRAWVRDFLARPKASKDVLRFAVESMAASRSALADWFGGLGSSESEQIAKSLHLNKPMYWRDSGVRTLTSGEPVPDARLPLQLLAHVAGAVEGGITRDAWRWQDNRRTDVARWFRFLVDQGYTLANVEQQIVDGAAK